MHFATNDDHMASTSSFGIAFCVVITVLLLSHDLVLVFQSRAVQTGTLFPWSRFVPIDSGNNIKLKDSSVCH